MPRTTHKLLTLLFTALLPLTVAQAAEEKDPAKEAAALYQGMAWRGIGPAFMSGRIADIAIDAQNENRWFVAVGSGGVWRTENNGVTWKPVFDNENRGAQISVRSGGVGNDCKSVWSIADAPNHRTEPTLNRSNSGRMA